MNPMLSPEIPGVDACEDDARNDDAFKISITFRYCALYLIELLTSDLLDGQATPKICATYQQTLY